MQEQHLYSGFDDEPLGILKPCYEAFNEAYLLHSRYPEHTYITVPKYSGTEVVRLHNWEKLENYKTLVAFKNYARRLFIMEDEEDIPRPLGIEKSREIQDYIKNAEVLFSEPGDVYNIDK